MRAAAGTILDALPVIVVDNVARYYFEHDPKEHWSIQNGDFPNLAPFIAESWMEWRHPGVINSHGNISKRVRGADVPYSIGAHVVGHKSEDGTWRVGFSLFWGFNSESEPQGPIALVLITCDEKGAYVENPAVPPGMVQCSLLNAGGRLDGVLQQAIVDSSIELIKPFLLAISFAHCKNVERREIEQPSPLSKKWQKRHGRPLVRYHILDIDPMRRVLRDEGGAEESGLKKALHICRGHFATYTEDAPLFGRVTGTFWKPQHVRGNVKHGVVVKDYNVKAPRTGS
jgi:hypothetical protein